MSESEAFGNSKAIVTNQDGIHEKLAEIVEKHASHTFQKPISAHTQAAFDVAHEKVKAFGGEIILDACCGVGQSTRKLAKQNPSALVIGVDKSANRIERNVDEHYGDEFDGVENYLLVRADLNDFFRLVEQAAWHVKKHYVLYPNPWPKSKHIQRRWHGSAVFPTMLKIGEQMILRSNWRLYLEEFAEASKQLGKSAAITALNTQDPLTPFEAKYLASGQQCYQLIVTLQKVQ